MTEGSTLNTSDRLNYVYKFSSYLRGITVRVHYQYEQDNTDKESNQHTNRVNSQVKGKVLPLQA
jgi:hypothetical protein